VLGHEITFIRPSAYRWYQRTALSQSILASVHHLVDVGWVGEVDELTAAIRDVLTQRRIDAIINTVDPTIEATAIVAAEFGLAFTSRQGIANARDKGLARALIADVGLASIDSVVVTKEEDVAAAVERLGLPVVLKPVSGFDSLMVQRADTVERAIPAAR